MIRHWVAAATAALVVACAGQAGAASFARLPVAGIAGPAGSNAYQVDYTVAPREQWNFWLDTTDPLATISLDRPNQVDQTLLYTDGHASGIYGGTYRWDVFQSPGKLSIQVDEPVSWNDCATPGVVGLCAVTYNVWGNGTTYLHVNSTEPWTLQWSVTSIVPEPATWAMMLMGIAGLGAALRANRRSIDSARA
jgi:PEP-CTERM motif-containing protein